MSACIAAPHAAVFKSTLTNLRSFFNSLYLDFCNYRGVDNHPAVQVK